MTLSAKTKLKIIESFPPPDLVAIRAGLREKAKGKIGYDHPAYFTQGLRVLWDSDYPVAKFKVLPS
jgi:hypothetical protein